MAARCAHTAWHPPPCFRPLIPQEVRDWLRGHPFKVGGLICLRTACLHTARWRGPAALPRCLLPLPAAAAQRAHLPPLHPPAQFEDSDVKILSGVDEGAFAWLTLNYLLGRLGGSEQDTGGWYCASMLSDAVGCCLLAGRAALPAKCSKRQGDGESRARCASGPAKPRHTVLAPFHFVSPHFTTPTPRPPSLPPHPPPAVASIDLGGGSVQEAYAMTAKEAAAAPDKQYLTELKSGGHHYHVYVYR